MIDLDEVAAKIEMITNTQVDTMLGKEEFGDKDATVLEKLTKVLVILHDLRLKKQQVDPFAQMSTDDLEVEFE